MINLAPVLCSTSGAPEDVIQTLHVLLPDAHFSVLWQFIKMAPLPRASTTELYLKGIPHSSTEQFLTSFLLKLN